MPRRYRRRRINRDKYSHETTNIQSSNISEWSLIPAINQYTMPSYQWSISIVPAVDSQGMRKVKHLTVSFSCAADVVLYYYIVFVPQGYQPQNIAVPTSSSAVTGYAANQFIMGSGVLDFSGGPLRVRSALSRNLNSGDSINIILASPYAFDHAVTAQVSYAITLQ